MKTHATKTKFADDIAATYTSSRAYEKDKRIQRLAGKQRDKRRRLEMQLSKQGEGMEQLAWV